MTWHQGREGLATPSLFSMTAVLGCRLSSALEGFSTAGTDLDGFGGSLQLATMPLGLWALQAEPVLCSGCTEGCDTIGLRP